MGMFSRDKAQEVLVFALRDSAANSFTMPMFYAAEGVAIRALTDAVNGGDKAISAHPQDYQLYRLGTYNPITGILFPAGPDLVVGAAQLVTK